MKENSKYDKYKVTLGKGEIQEIVSWQTESKKWNKKSVKLLKKCGKYIKIMKEAYELNMETKWKS